MAAAPAKTKDNNPSLSRKANVLFCGSWPPNPSASACPSCGAFAALDCGFGISDAAHRLRRLRGIRSHRRSFASPRLGPVSAPYPPLWSKRAPAFSSRAPYGGATALMRVPALPLCCGALAVLTAYGGDWGRIECARTETRREPVQKCGRFESTPQGLRYNASSCYPSGTTLVARCVAAKCREGFTHGSGEPRLGPWQSGPPRACLTEEEAARRGTQLRTPHDRLD